MEYELAKKLLDAAANARLNARVPLSGFHVGAALLADNGDIITGCNAEQGNMYESICAERCAITKAVSMGYRHFTAVAVVCDGDYPLAPCGLCRHALIDFGPDITVLMSSNDQKKVVLMTTGQLMPAYDLEHSELPQALETLFEGKADDK